MPRDFATGELGEVFDLFRTLGAGNRGAFTQPPGYTPPPALQPLSLSQTSVSEGAGPGAVISPIVGLRPGSTVGFAQNGNAGGRVSIIGTNLVVGPRGLDREDLEILSISLVEILDRSPNSPRTTSNLLVDVLDVVEPSALEALELSSPEVDEGVSPGDPISGFLHRQPGSFLELVAAGSAGGRVAIANGALVAGSTPINSDETPTLTISVREILDGAPNSPRTTTLTISVVRLAIWMYELDDKSLAITRAPVATGMVDRDSLVVEGEASSIVALSLQLGAELRGSGVVAKTGAATTATYDTTNGQGRVYRAGSVNAHSRVEIPSLPYATFRLDIEVTAASAGSLQVRTSSAGGVLMATLAVGQRQTIDAGAIDGVVFVMPSANNSNVNFTIHSIKQVTQAPQAAGAWAHETFEVSDGRKRTVSYYQPSTGVGPWPVAVILHGGGLHGFLTAGSVGVNFQSVAEQNGWLLVAPQAYSGRWSYGVEPPDDLPNAVAADPNPDGEYLDEALRRAGLCYRTDGKNTFFTGVSAGGMMAYRHAAVGQRKPTAMALVATTKQTLAPAPSGVPLLHIHGSADASVPLLGGVGADTAAGVSYRAAQTGIDEWQAAGNVATLTVLQGGTHEWQPTPGYDTNSQVAAFLNSHKVAA